MGLRRVIRFFWRCWLLSWLASEPGMENSRQLVPLRSSKDSLLLCFLLFIAREYFRIHWKNRIDVPSRDLFHWPIVTNPPVVWSLRLAPIIIFKSYSQFQTQNVVPSIMFMFLLCILSWKRVLHVWSNAKLEIWLCGIHVAFTVTRRPRQTSNSRPNPRHDLDCSGLLPIFAWVRHPCSFPMRMNMKR